MRDFRFLLEGSLSYKRVVRKGKSKEKEGEFGAATKLYTKYNLKRKVRKGDIKQPDTSDELSKAEDERENLKQTYGPKEREKSKGRIRSLLQISKHKRVGHKVIPFRKIKTRKS